MLSQMVLNHEMEMAKMDNRTRRDRGMAYVADEEVFLEMAETRRKIQEFNRTDAGDLDSLRKLAYKLLGRAGRNLMITPPFFCDYGTHIEVGDNFFANYGCTILDVAKVEIGDNVFFAPHVSIYTAGHPIHPDSRNSMYEYGLPVKIGGNTWIGGNVVIVPGVTIGEGCVIGAGSVVTRDVPPFSVAAGNPCRVIRAITDDDRKYYCGRREFDPEAWRVVCEKMNSEKRKSGSEK